MNSNNTWNIYFLVLTAAVCWTCCCFNFTGACELWFACAVELLFITGLKTLRKSMTPLLPKFLYILNCVKLSHRPLMKSTKKGIRNELENNVRKLGDSSCQAQVRFPTTRHRSFNLQKSPPRSIAPLCTRYSFISIGDWNANQVQTKEPLLFVLFYKE